MREKETFKCQARLITEFRKQKRYSQYDIADEAGLHSQGISNMETGKAPISMTAAHAMVRLGMNPHRLFAAAVKDFKANWIRRFEATKVWRTNVRKRSKTNKGNRT